MSNAETIARTLGGRPSGRGWICRCPVPGHGNGKGDRNPSLSIADGDTALLVKCFAGCDSRDVLDELRRQGLLERPALRSVQPPHVDELIERIAKARAADPKFRLSGPRHAADRSVRIAVRGLADRLFRAGLAPWLVLSLTRAWAATHRPWDIDDEEVVTIVDEAAGAVLKRGRAA